MCIFYIYLCFCPHFFYEFTVIISYFRTQTFFFDDDFLDLERLFFCFVSALLLLVFRSLLGCFFVDFSLAGRSINSPALRLTNQYCSKRAINSHETQTKNTWRVVANESSLVPMTTRIFNGIRKIFIIVACNASGITALRNPPPHAKLTPTHVSNTKNPPYTK